MGTIASKVQNGPWQVEPGQVWKLQGGESALRKDCLLQRNGTGRVGPLAPLSDPAQSHWKHPFKLTVWLFGTPEQSLLLCSFTH